MDEIKYPAAFRKSFSEIEEFHRKWLKQIFVNCKDEPHRYAALSAWSRYAISIRTLDRLLEPNLLPDVYVICRGGIEYSATLEVVIKDAAVAQEYLDFEPHGRAHYIRLHGEFGDPSRQDFLRANFKKQYGQEIEQYTRTKWYRGGISKLLRDLKRNSDILSYNLLCHWAHGNIMAMQAMMGGIDNPPMSLASVVRATYCNYLDSTRKFVTFISESTNWKNGEECKRDIVDLTQRHVAEAK